MRDWRKLVRERLSGRGLAVAQQDEVVTELAGHLEDRFERERALGLDEPDAIRCALNEVDDWHALARRIHRARRQEDLMNYRTKSLWVPALVCTLAAMGSRMLLMIEGIEPRVLYAGSKAGSMGLEIYLPWLVMLPVIEHWRLTCPGEPTASALRASLQLFFRVLYLLGSFSSA